MKRFICILLTLSLALCLFGCGAGEKEKDNTGLEIADNAVIFFETKNDADCSLIHCSDKNVLIDSGEKNDAKKILKQLEELGINRIDMVIISHFDKDHIGGLIKMIDDIEIGKILHPKYIKDSEEAEKLFDKIDELQIEHSAISKDKTLDVGGINLALYPPKNDVYKEKQSNNSSMVVMAKIDGKKFLYTGDSQEERVQELLDSKVDFSADVLKLMYHGREVANEERYVSNISPSHTVITGDKDDKKVRKNIESLAHALGNYRYTSDGNIVFEIANDNLIVQ